MTEQPFIFAVTHAEDGAPRMGRNVKMYERGGSYVCLTRLGQFTLRYMGQTNGRHWWFAWAHPNIATVVTHLGPNLMHWKDAPISSIGNSTEKEIYSGMRPFVRPVEIHEDGELVGYMPPDYRPTVDFDTTCLGRKRTGAVTTVERARPRLKNGEKPRGVS